MNTITLQLHKISLGAAVIAWLPDLDNVFRIAASLIAIIAGLPIAIRTVKDLLARFKSKG